MANVQVTALMDGHDLYDLYRGMQEKLVEKSDVSATFADVNHGTQIIVEGENFTYHDGAITGGTVDAVHFTNVDGDDFAVVTDLALDAAKVSKWLAKTNPLRLLEPMFNHADIWTGSDSGDFMPSAGGNDQLFGGGGDDHLSGELGRDTLTGGDGSDYFLLRFGTTHDVVTDFHANGELGVHDFIEVSSKHHRIIDRGDDTLIRLDRHNSLLLKNVDSADITAEDFYDPRHPGSSSFNGSMHHDHLL